MKEKAMEHGFKPTRQNFEIALKLLECGIFFGVGVRSKNSQRQFRECMERFDY